MILAIDPGNEQSAFTLYNEELNKVIDKGILSNFLMEAEITTLFQMYGLSEVAIEMIASYGMAVGQTVFNTCVQIGRFQKIVEFLNVKCTLVFRKQVCMHICNSTRAGDSNIMTALIDRFGVKGTKKSPGFFYGFKDDIWQAFAIAVYIADTNKCHKLVGDV